MSMLSDAYRFLPRFKGKKRIGSFLFKGKLSKNSESVISCKKGLKYIIVNTRDSVGRDLFFDGIYEPQTIKVIQQNLEEGDIMIDAGANIGAISIPVATQKEIKVFSFEPGRNNFSVLQKNISLNHLKNITSINLALSNKAGEVDFYESDRIHGGSGIVKIEGFNHYKAAATTLDIFAKENNIKKIAVLKIDVQGWEYFLLKGCEELITNKRIENIIFEFEGWAEKNAGLQPGAAQQFLLDKEYSLQTLGGQRLITPLTSGTFMIHAKA